MKENLIDLLLVIDAGSAAQALAPEVIRSYNALVKGLRETGAPIHVTIVITGEKAKTLYEAREIAAVPTLTKRQYAPEGSPALIGAAGAAIDAAGVRLNGTPEEERPGKVVVAVVSFEKKDIGEDASALAASIAHQRKIYSWMFLYLASSGNAAKRAGAIGIPERNASAFAADENGVRTAFQALYTAVTAIGVTGDVPQDWQKGIAKRIKREAESTTKASGGLRA